MKKLFEVRFTFYGIEAEEYAEANSPLGALFLVLKAMELSEGEVQNVSVFEAYR